MKSNLRKGISVLLCLAMVFAMIPNFSGVSANAESSIGSQGEDVIIEDNFPGENDKPEVLAAEPEGSAQLEIFGSEETEKTGTWAEYILQSPQTMKYKYADFSPFFAENVWVEPKAGGKYTISTAAELAGLMVIVNADVNTTIKDNKDRQITIKSTRVSFSGCTIKLTEKIDLNAHEWVPIGKDENHSFSANLDGSATKDGICKIQGMKIGSESSHREYQYAGLIGYVKGENITISNVGIDNNSGIYISTSGVSHVYVGGIIGYAVKGIKMINCYNTGAISDGKYYSSNVGGLVGFVSADVNNEVRLENCYNTGTISGGESFSGGLVGYAYANGNAEVRLENCYNSGEISGRGLVGGIVGSFNHKVGCYAKVRLKNCYNSGIISSEYHVGGIVGKVMVSTADAEVRLENCYNSGEISGENNAGGLVGCAKASTADTEVNLENCYNSGEISGENNAGGLVGWVSFTKGAEVRLENCYNTGTISCKYQVGGIAGAFDYGEGEMLENCYYLGATQGVGNRADEESGAINLLKDAQTESVELRPNDIKTIKNTEANVNLCANSELQKLGKGFKMEYVYSTPKDITISSPDTSNRLSISAKDGAKSREVTLTGIRVTQNDLTANGYTGKTFTFDINVTAAEKRFNVYIVYNLTLIENGGSWVDGSGPKTYKQGESSILPTDEDIKQDNCKLAGWSTQSDETGEILTEIPEDQVGNITLYAKWEEIKCHAVKFDPNNEHVTIKSVQYGRSGETVKVEVTPDGGYEVGRVYVNGEKQVLEKKQALEERKEQNFYYEFTFTMPDEDAVIKVTMQELDGWVRAPEKCEETGTPWWYYYKDDEKLTGWQEIEIQVEGREEQVQRYYFDPEKGNAAHTGWMKDENSNWYYFAVNHYRNATLLETPEQGLAMMWTGWANDGGPKWYYLDAVKQDFASGRGIMKTGWIQDGGKEWYYFKSDDTQNSIYGSIVIGWGYIDGKWYYFTDDESENMRYYGQMQRGWQLIDGYWYYFYDDGAMASNTWIGDYFVDENGRWIS